MTPDARRSRGRRADERRGDGTADERPVSRAAVAGGDRGAVTARRASSITGSSGCTARSRTRDALDGDEDLYPFWALSTAVLVGLHDLHEARP